MKNIQIAGQSLEWLLNGATDAMLIIDGSGHIVLTNPALCQLFGMTHEQLLGQTIEILLPQRFRHGHVGMRAEFFKQPRARSMGTGMALFAMHHEGREFPVEVSLSPLETSQGLPLVLATIHDITQRKAAEAALQASKEALRRLAAHQENIKERERQRIAQEIHDELGGLLTGIKAYISVVLGRAEASGAPADPLLGETHKLAQDAIETVRRVITDLRPSVLDQLGVWPALEWYGAQVAQRSGLKCETHVAPDTSSLLLDPERSTMVFRVVQEALTNVVRHADATEVHIAAHCDKGILYVTVTDNGKGIDAERLLNGDSWGIQGMHERTRHFDGELKITGQPGKGTTLQLRLPLEKKYEQ
jgi:two-component system sensor histidine kinase UhpB